jgi:hypothetical protein
MVVRVDRMVVCFFPEIPNLQVKDGPGSKRRAKIPNPPNRPKNRPISFELRIDSHSRLPIMESPATSAPSETHRPCQKMLDKYFGKVKYLANGVILAALWQTGC